MAEAAGEDAGRHGEGRREDGGPDPRAIDPRLLELLVCPLTKGPLTFDRAKAELISERARLAYPVRDGVAIMLVSEARHLDDDPAVPPRRR